MCCPLDGWHTKDVFYHLCCKVCVVTGGGSGIGAAFVRRAVVDGARAVVVADISLTAAERTAAQSQRSIVLHP